MLKRQGDILLERVDAAPFDAGGQRVRHEDGVIALGEVTGHAHVLTGDGELVSQRGRLMALVGPEGAEVVHDEHDSLELEEGIWVVHRQTEYVGKGETALAYD